MRVVYYIIHNTHTIAHINLSIWSLQQQSNKLIWDKLVIKNSIVDQIPNETVQMVLNKYKMLDIFSQIEFVKAGEINTTYYDLKTALEFAQINKITYLLFTKAEYCYSINTFTVFEGLFNKKSDNWVYTPPIVNATEFIKENEIYEYLERKKFIKSDSITGYDGDDLHRLPAKKSSIFQRIVSFLLKRNHIVIGDIGNKNIDAVKNNKFIAHNVVLDINVHLFAKQPIELMDFKEDEINLSWGRIRSLDRLLKNGVNFIIDYNCFSLHQFHEIPSDRMGRNINGVRY